MATQGDGCRRGRLRSQKSTSDTPMSLLKWSVPMNKAQGIGSLGFVVVGLDPGLPIVRWTTDLFTLGVVDLHRPVLTQDLACL